MLEITAKSFEEILAEYENMIYFLMKKFQIRDPEGEFYQEGIIALWKAVETYDEKRGKFSSYAYFLIEKAFLTLIRKSNKTSQNEEALLMLAKADMFHTTSQMDMEFDTFLLEQLDQTLTQNQMKWFKLFILEDLSIKEIAAKEQVSVDAVKNWARLAKPKIQKIFGEE